jgi:hypothetical protein
MQGYAELEFDLPSALLVALLRKFDEIVPATLTAENAFDVPDEQGVYMLYHRQNPNDDPKLVYIGKTDSEAGLKARLRRHARKLLGRHRLDPKNVLYKALRLYVFTAMDLETELIRHSGGVAQVPWNNSGFGSNDPGRERDTTKYKAEHFDTQFPIDIDSTLVIFETGKYRVSSVIGRLKSILPYVVRYERPGRGRASFHEDFENTEVVLRKNSTTRECLAACIGALPVGWHATKLPSHIIVYKNDSRKFPSGEPIAGVKG